MFSLPKFVRVGPSRVSGPDGCPPVGTIYSLAFSLGEDPLDPLFSLRSHGASASGAIPAFDVPLSRELLAVSGSFRLVLIADENSVHGLSSGQHLGDQALRVEQSFPFSGGFSVESRVELYPSGSVVVREDCASAISDCALCLPRLPGRRQCYDCGGVGRAVCGACLGESEVCCPRCQGRGYGAA